MRVSILSSAVLAALVSISGSVHAISATDSDLTTTDGDFNTPNAKIALNSVDGYKLEVLADVVNASAKLRGIQVSKPTSSVLVGQSTTQTVNISVGLTGDLSTSPVGVYATSGGQAKVIGSNISILAKANQYKPVGISVDTNGVATIGNSFTQNLSITAEGGEISYGVKVIRGKTFLSAKRIEVNSDNVGLHVSNQTDSETLPDDTGYLNVVGETVVINGKEAGIEAMSNGHLDLNGNVTITGTDAILARGHALVNINTDEKAKTNSTVLNGNINFHYDGPTSKTVVDAQVNINLVGTQSRWDGNVLVSWNELDPKQLEKDPSLLTVKNMTLTLADGATWTPTVIEDSDTDVGNGHKTGNKSVALNKLNFNDGIITIENSTQTVNVEELSGEGGTVNVRTEITDSGFDTGNLAIDKITSQVDAPVISVNYDGITADDLKNPEDALGTLGGVTVGTGSTDAKGVELILNVAEGDVNGAITQTVDKDGNRGEVHQAVNQKLDGYSSIAALSAVQWRHETDTLLKRMGELRDAEGTIGAWARIYGSEQEYGAQSVKTKNTTIQVGSDYDIGSGWTVGGAFSYTDGSSTFDLGESDSKMYGLSLYGTYLAENGLFVDLIGKYSRLSNDFTSGTMTGDFDNNAFSIAAETGWHYAFNTLGFIEPSVGVTYGRIMGDDFVAHNGVKVEQDDYDSLIGRVGVRGGFYFPEKKGNIYARVAVLHDFMGDMEATASKYNENTGLNTSHIKEELGDTWIEYGVGANFKLAKNAYTFVDLEKTAGGDVKENWKWTIGARYLF